jgi:hypothetical protein
MLLYFCCHDSVLVKGSVVDLGGTGDREMKYDSTGVQFICLGARALPVILLGIGQSIFLTRLEQ